MTPSVTRSVRNLRCSKATERKCRLLIHRHSSSSSSGRGRHVPCMTVRSEYRRTSLQIDSCLAFLSARPPTASTSTYDQQPRTVHVRLRSRPRYFNAAMYVVLQSHALSTSGCSQLLSDVVRRPGRRRPMTRHLHQRQPRLQQLSAARHCRSRCHVV